MNAFNRLFFVGLVATSYLLPLQGKKEHRLRTTDNATHALKNPGAATLCDAWQAKQRCVDDSPEHFVPDKLTFDLEGVCPPELLPTIAHYLDAAYDAYAVREPGLADASITIDQICEKDHKAVQDVVKILAHKFATDPSFFPLAEPALWNPDGSFSTVVHTIFALFQVADFLQHQELYAALELTLKKIASQLAEAPSSVIETILEQDKDYLDVHLPIINNIMASHIVQKHLKQDPICTQTLIGHTADVNAASFSHDGSKVVTASDDNTAKIWDVASGSLLFTLRHADKVLSARFSPDGAKIATSSCDNTAKIWDLVPHAALLSKKLDLDEALFLVLASRQQAGLKWTEALRNIYHNKLNNPIRHYMQKYWHIELPADLTTLSGHKRKRNDEEANPNKKQRI